MGATEEGKQRRNREILPLNTPKDSWTAGCVVEGVVVENERRKDKQHNDSNRKLQRARGHNARGGHNLAAVLQHGFNEGSDEENVRGPAPPATELCAKLQAAEMELNPTCNQN